MANRDLTPWSGGRGLSAFDPLTSFRRQMDELFDTFLSPAEGRSFAAPMERWPSIDLREDDQAYTVTADLPGLEAKDVELNLRDDVLTISGEKRQEHREEDRGRSYTERTYGRFQRAIPLEGEVDADKVEADFRNGVLKVTLPKNPKTAEKTRRIEVRSGGNGETARS